jgi:chromosome segregation ATPase
MLDFHVCTPECFQRPNVECLLCQLWAQVVFLIDSAERLFSMAYKNEEKFENELVASKATCLKSLENQKRVIDQRLFELREEDQKIQKEVASVDQQHNKVEMELREQNLELREKNCSLKERLSSLESQMSRLHRRLERLERDTSSTDPDKTLGSDASC